MCIDLIAILLGYIVASFALTAFFVRLQKKAALAVMIRRHFYCFPMIPALLIALSFLQGVTWIWHILFVFLRYCFEMLSGKKTYRRRKRGYYNYD